MLSRATLIFGLLLCAFAGSPAWAEKRVALVIGNSAYKSVAKLANPVNDAAAVAEMFRKAQFEVVESKHDLNFNEMRRALREFTDKSRDADMAVVYYAGHGIEIDGQNYLVPIDALLERDSDAFDEAMPLDRVLQVIEPAKKLRLVILDACRDNPFARTMRRTLASRALGRGLVGVEPGKPNTLIAFAAKAGSTADDGTGANSPFTTALLKHLTTPGLDLRKAFGHIRDDVIKATGNRQEPFVYGSLGGSDVSLVAAPAQRTQPAASALIDVRRDYELALQIGTREGFELFLTQYPAGFYAGLAKAQLNKIAAEEARMAAAEKARQAEAEKARLASEKASAEAQAKAAREAKAAEDARIVAEKQRQAEQAKAEAGERARAQAERLAAEKLGREQAEAGAKAKAAAEVKAAQEKVEAAKLAAEKAAAVRAAEAKAGTEKASEDKTTQLAALPTDAPRTALTSSEINRLLQVELRRVGCHTANANDEWNVASRRSLELFNMHAGTKLDIKLASLDALDAVKAKQVRICPLVCQNGFRSNGEKCEKIVCRPGFAVGDENTCEKIEPKKPLASSDAPATAQKGAIEPKSQKTGQQQVFCNINQECRPVRKGCRLEENPGSTGIFRGFSFREVCP